ncbi:MAG: zinc-binding alcohol dehydrogenase family protein [Gemmobacter sp.]
MRVVLCSGYGPAEEVLRIAERPDPAAAPDGIVVSLRAAPVSRADLRIRTADFPRGFSVPGRLALGWRGPRQPVLGAIGTGVVAAVGRSVRGWREGDPVVLTTGMRMGCHAELVALPANAAVVPKPASLDWAEAAALPFGAMTALHFLTRAGVEAGKTVLVIGAAGAVGLAAVQIAALAGAEVTAVARSEHHALLSDLGAAATIPVGAVPTARYDLVLDAAGLLGPRSVQRLLRPDGRHLAVAADLPLTLRAMLDRQTLAGPAPDSRDSLRSVLDLAEAGRLRPVIDRTYPLVHASSAHRRAETPGRMGSVILLS